MIEIITGRPTRVEIPAKIARRVQDLAVAKTPFSTGFRLHKQLRALVQAHALYRGDVKVKMEDFEEIRRQSKFMNLPLPPNLAASLESLYPSFGREGDNKVGICYTLASSLLRDCLALPLACHA